MTIDSDACRTVEQAVPPALAVLLALLWLGCATPGPSPEDQDAKRATSMLNIGADHLQNGRVGLALREFLRAEALDPRNPRIQYGLGEAYWARNRLDDAERHFLRALELFPDHHDSRMTLSALLIRLERYEEAVGETRILVDDPTYPAPWRALANQGWAELQRGRVEAAREALDEALMLSPNYWPATLSLAILEAREGRPLEAAELFQELLSAEPGPAAESEVNYRLAELYVSLGNHRRAVRHLAASVARQPEGPWAKKAEEYLELIR